LNHTQKQLIVLLKNAIFGKSEFIPDCDFPSIEKLAVAHSCVSVAYQGAVFCKLNTPQTWKNVSYITLINNYKNLHVQKKVLDIYKKHNIDCAVIKGITASVNYAVPMCRALGDIDILVRESDYEKAVSLLGQKTDTRENKFHTAFMYEGVSVEIHKGVDNYKLSSGGKAVFQKMSTALDEISLIDFDGFTIPCLQSEYTAIMYLNHMKRHFSDNELSVRMFCDWVGFISSISNEEWTNKIYPSLIETGLNLFADAINLAACKYMNLDLFSKIKNNFDDSIIDNLMEEFVFDGTKSGDEFLDGNIANAYVKSGCEESLIKRTANLLNDISNREFKLSKYKILLPFLWVYIMIRYFIRAANGKRKFISYKKISETIDRRRNIKKELGLN